MLVLLVAVGCAAPSNVDDPDGAGGAAGAAPTAGAVGSAPAPCPDVSTVSGDAVIISQPATGTCPGVPTEPGHPTQVVSGKIGVYEPATWSVSRSGDVCTYEISYHYSVSGIDCEPYWVENVEISVRSP